MQGLLPLPAGDHVLASLSRVRTRCAVVFLGTLALLWLKSWWDMRNAVPLDVSAACGDITPEELAKHDGRDPFKPIYFSVQGRVFDVTAGRDFYGPGAPSCRPATPQLTSLTWGRAYGVTALRNLGWPQCACLPIFYRQPCSAIACISSNRSGRSRQQGPALHSEFAIPR